MEEGDAEAVVVSVQVGSCSSASSSLRLVEDGEFVVVEGEVF